MPQPRPIRAIAQYLNPARSVRVRLAFAFGGLTMLAMALFVLVIELWSRALGLPETQLAVSRLQGQLVGVGLFLSALFVLIGWMMAERIARPLADIATSARLLRDGAGTTLEPAASRQDEIGSLARTLRDMMRALNERTSALEQSSADLQIHLLERTRRLAAITELLALANEQDDLKTILERSLAQVLAASSGQIGMIHSLEERNARLLAVRGLEPMRLDQVRAPAFGAALLNLISGAGDDQAALREPGLGANQTKDPEPKDTHMIVATLWHDDQTVVAGTAPLALWPELGVYLGAPVMVSGRLWGVMSLFGDGLTPFTAEERALFDSVASQIGFLVERFRLRRRVEQIAVLEERNRLARELHDSVTQSLYSVALFAEAGGRAARAGQHQKTLDYLDEVGEMSRQALKEMRLLVYKLRPAVLVQEGLVAALDQRLKAVENRAGIEAHLLAPSELSLSAEQEDAIYQVAVEALNNGLKHARATSIRVELIQAEDRCLTLRVSDNGVGFDPAVAEHGGGLGLTSMRERAAGLGGTLIVESTAGAGTIVSLRMPAG